MVRVKRRHILFRLNPTNQALPSPKSLDITEQEIYNSIRKTCYTVWKNEKKAGKNSKKNFLGFFRSKTLKTSLKFLRFEGFDLKNPKKIFFDFLPAFFSFFHTVWYLIHGTIGGAKAMQNFKVKYINVYTGIGYMSSLHAYHKTVLSSLNFITSVGQVSATFQTLHVSGTIKSCQKYLLKFHKRSFEKLCKDFSGLSDERKEIINNSIKCELQDDDAVVDDGGDGMLVD